MAVTTLDQYNYSTVRKPQTNNLCQVRILVDGNTDPVLSDIESKLIDSENKAFLEGAHFLIKNTFVRHIGSATVLVLEVD